jgi:hypothetical protein
MSGATNPYQNDVKRRLDEGQSFIEQIQAKMNTLVGEFAQGEISREQFQKIYDHYQQQIILTTQLMADANASVVDSLSAGKTMGLRESLTGQALSLAVYYHTTRSILETAGNFDMPTPKLLPFLNSLAEQVAQGRVCIPQTQIIDGKWLLFIPGKFSTVVILFSHEPAARQISILERMHRDFEAANEKSLRGGQVDTQNLVYPFEALVRKTAGTP